MKRLIIILLCLLPLSVIGQELERLCPIKVASIVPVQKDTTHYDRNSLEWSSQTGDTNIDFFECRSDTGVVGYLMKSNEYFQRLFFEAKVNGKLLDDAWLPEVQRTEEVLSEVLNLRADSVQMIPEVFTAPRYYRFTRQYIIYLDKKGDTCAYINCLMADDYHHPERSFISVCDGGDNYWQVKLNLTRRQLMDTRINGPMVVYVSGRAEDSHGLDSLTVFNRQDDSKEYFDCYYDDLPRNVQHNLPKEYPIDMLTKYDAFKYKGNNYYTVSYSNGAKVGFNHLGQWLSLYRWQGITQEEMSRVTGTTRVYDAIVKEMEARGRNFQLYGQVRWVERVKNYFVVNICYFPSNDPSVSDNAGDMTATLTIDKKGHVVAFIIN